MTPSNDPVRSAIAQQAADWFVANRDDALDSSERAAFAGWLRSSAMHVEEYLATMAAAHDMRDACQHDFPLETLIAEARADVAGPVTWLAPRAARPGQRSPARWTEWLGALVPPAVAAAVLACGTAVLWLERDNWLRAPSDYQTALGERATRTLPDGSTLVLDADSAVTTRYGLNERLVEVTRGRAHFSVAHGSRRPFRVVAGAATAIAVGTEFDVDRREQATIVTVIEGAVRVRASAEAEAPGRAAPPGELITAGERVRVTAAGQLLHDPAPNVEAASSWQQGTISFDREPLGEVIEEFNRYAAIGFEIGDPELRRLRISGVFDARDAESFSRFVESLEAVRVERTPERFRVTRAPPQRPH